VLVYF